MIEDILSKSIATNDLMSSLKLEITNKCNLKCSHCYVGNRSCSTCNDELSIDIIKDILKQAKELNIISIVLTGGEPMCHTEFWKIVKMIKEMNFYLVVYSNITLINESNIELVKKYIHLINTTRYGYTAITYDNTTNIKGSFNKYINAINLLKENKIKFNQRAMLLKSNEHEVKDLYNCCDKKFGVYICCKHDEPYAINQRSSDSAIYYYYDKVFESKHIQHRSMDDKICNLCQSRMCIKSNGDIVPCINWPKALGNINNVKLNEVWTSGERKEIRDKNLFKNFKKCYNCEDNKYLQFICPSDNFYETDNMFEVSDEMCRLCKITKEVCKNNNLE